MNAYLTGGVGGIGEDVVLPEVGVAVEFLEGVLFILITNIKIHLPK